MLNIKFSLNLLPLISYTSQNASRPQRRPQLLDTGRNSFRGSGFFFFLHTPSTINLSNMNSFAF